VTDLLEALEKQITESQGAPLPEGVAALRNALKTHGKNLDTTLDERLHLALTAAGDPDGWQRWLADQVRTDLVTQAEALLDANKVPTVGAEKCRTSCANCATAGNKLTRAACPTTRCGSVLMPLAMRPTKPCWPGWSK
jgi:hypothetical protein